MSIVEKLKGGLIVSCQAYTGDPLYGSGIMAAMAKAAEIGGAVGIRANGTSDIKEIKKVTTLPIIGIYKDNSYDSEIYITPTLKEVEEVFMAGADMIAIDATDRLRPDRISLNDFIKEIKVRTKMPIMADVSTLQEGINAQKAGAAIVSTTLSGYTNYTKKQDGPDFDLLIQLVAHLSIPVILEGRVNRPEEAKEALKIGAFSVVVGSAITRPRMITARFVKAMRRA